LILFNDSITARKVLELILMVVRQVHWCVQLFKINEPILNNVPPNRSRNGFVELLLLHDINDCIDGLFRSE
jgi:hypothetical protein